jgi:hypothetical protein
VSTNTIICFLFILQLNILLTENPHVPDMKYPDGLLSILALGNLLQCSKALSWRAYTSEGLTGEQIRDHIVSNIMYSKVCKVFCQRHTVTVNKKIVHPSYIIGRSFMEFASSATVYVEAADENELLPEGNNISAARVKRRLRRMLKRRYPEFISRFDQLTSSESKQKYLGWTGGDIVIYPRTSFYEPTEARELELWPIYKALEEEESDGDMDGLYSLGMVNSVKKDERNEDSEGEDKAKDGEGNDMMEEDAEGEDETDEEREGEEEMEVEIEKKMDEKSDGKDEDDQVESLQGDDSGDVQMGSLSPVSALTPTLSSDEEEQPTPTRALRRSTRRRNRVSDEDQGKSALIV